MEQFYDPFNTGARRRAPANQVAPLTEGAQRIVNEQVTAERKAAAVDPLDAEIRTINERRANVRYQREALKNAENDFLSKEGADLFEKDAVTGKPITNPDGSYLPRLGAEVENLRKKSGQKVGLLAGAFSSKAAGDPTDEATAATARLAEIEPAYRLKQERYDRMKSERQRLDALEQQHEARLGEIGREREARYTVTPENVASAVDSVNAERSMRGQDLVRPEDMAPPVRKQRTLADVMTLDVQKQLDANRTPGGPDYLYPKQAIKDVLDPAGNPAGKSILPEAVRTRASLEASAKGMDPIGREIVELDELRKQGITRIGDRLIDEVLAERGGDQAIATVRTLETVRKLNSRLSEIDQALPNAGEAMKGKLERERLVVDKLRQQKQGLIDAIPTGQRIANALGSLASGLAEIPAGLSDWVAISAKKLDEELPQWAQSYEGKETSDLATARLAATIREFAQKVAPTDPRLAEEFWSSKVPNGIGSMLGFLGPGAVTKSRYLVPLVLGMGVSGAQGYKDAIDNGATKDQAWLSFLLNTGVGASEIVPVSRMLDRLDKGTGGQVKKALIDAGKEGLEEMLQEFFQTTAGNAIAKELYDQNRDYFEGAGDSAGVGGVTGVLTSLVVSAIPGKNRGATPPATPAATPPAATPPGQTPATGAIPPAPTQTQPGGATTQPPQPTRNQTPPQTGQTAAPGGSTLPANPPAAPVASEETTLDQQPVKTFTVTGKNGKVETVEATRESEVVAKLPKDFGAIASIKRAENAPAKPAPIPATTLPEQPTATVVRGSGETAEPVAPASTPEKLEAGEPSKELRELASLVVYESTEGAKPENAKSLEDYEMEVSLLEEKLKRGKTLTASDFQGVTDGSIAHAQWLKAERERSPEQLVAALREAIDRKKQPISQPPAATEQPTPLPSNELRSLAARVIYDTTEGASNGQVKSIDDIEMEVTLLEEKLKRGRKLTVSDIQGITDGSVAHAAWLKDAIDRSPEQLVAALREAIDRKKQPISQPPAATSDKPQEKPKPTPAPVPAAEKPFDYNEAVRRSQRGTEARYKLDDVRPVVRDAAIAFVRTGKTPNKKNVTDFLASRGTIGAVDSEVAEILKAYPLAKADFDGLDAEKQLSQPRNQPNVEDVPNPENAASMSSDDFDAASSRDVDFPLYAIEAVRKRDFVEADAIEKLALKLLGVKPVSGESPNNTLQRLQQKRSLGGSAGLASWRSAIHSALKKSAQSPLRPEQPSTPTPKAPAIARGANRPAKFIEVVAKSSGLKGSSRGAKFLQDFTPRIHRANPRAFEDMEVHILNNKEWAENERTGATTPDSAAAYDPATNTLYINSDKTKGDEVINAVVHESGHFAEKFALGESFTQGEWEKLDDAQREAADRQYNPASKKTGAELKTDKRARAEWTAMQFARVVRGETEGMSKGLKARLEAWLNEIRALVNKWIGDGRLTTKALDAKILELLGGEYAEKAAPAAPAKSKAEQLADQLFDGLLGTPATLEQIALPKERRQIGIDFADAMISDGITTPEAMARWLDDKAQKKARKFSDSVWSLFRFSDPTLPQAPDWNELYRAIDNPGEAKPENTVVADKSIVQVPTSMLRLSTDVPQFKKNANAETGVVEPLAGKYDPTGNVLQVWRRTTGRLEIISGRHRFDLARRNGVPFVAVQIHDEAAGFDVRAAARLDAELNIRDGQGSVADYANYFKNSDVTEGDAEARGLLARAKGKAGFRLAREASQDLFALHQAGRINDAQAEAIITAARDNVGAQQVGIRTALDGGSSERITDMVTLAKQAADKKKSEGETGDLFGFDDSAMRDMEAQAALAAKERKELSEQIAAVQGAAKRPEIAKKFGVNAKNPKSILAKVEQLRARIEELKAHPDRAGKPVDVAAPPAKPVAPKAPAAPSFELRDPTEDEVKAAAEAKRKREQAEAIEEKANTPLKGDAGDQTKDMFGGGDMALFDAAEPTTPPPAPKPAPVEPPPAILDTVKFALKMLRESEATLQRNQKDGPVGRESAWKAEQAGIKTQVDRLAEFRKFAPSNGVDAEAVIASLGGEPDFSRFKAQSEAFAADERASKKPAPKFDAKLKNQAKDAFDGLLGTPADANYDENIPNDRAAKFLPLAQQLVSQGVNTPERVAQFLDETFDGKARKFSQSLWNFLSFADTNLTGRQDWASVYRALDNQAQPEVTPPPAQEPSRDAALIDRIVRAARVKPPTVVEIFELKGDDGNWYRPYGFPLKVKHTGEKRSIGFAVQAENGSTVGQREDTRQAVLDRHEANQDENAETFRKELEKMEPERLADQAKYWLRETKTEKTPAAPTETTVESTEQIDTFTPEQATAELAKRGITVSEEKTNSGKKVWHLKGKTFDVKDTLKSLGARWYAPAKVWTIFSNENPTQRLANALAGKAEAGTSGPPAKNDAGPSRDADEDLRLKQLRDRLDGSSDERGARGDAIASVGSDTASLIRRGLKFGMPEEVVSDQIEDIATITNAYQAARPMFLLGNGAGTGKTFVLGGAIRELRAKGAGPFVYVTMNQDLIEQIKRDLADYGVSDVSFHTYSETSTAGVPVPENAVLIFDEAHNVKNADSSRGEKAQLMMGRAKFTIFASATPFENPVEAAYLSGTGIFNSAGGHTEWGKAYGASVRRWKEMTSTGMVEREELFWQNGKLEDGLAARQWLVRQGIMVTRPMRLPEHMIESQFSKRSVAREWVDLYNQVEVAYDSAMSQFRDENGKILDARNNSQVAMHQVNTVKRILEAAKVDHAVEEAQRILAEGGNVVIFVETKSDRSIGRYRTSQFYDKNSPLYTYPEMLGLMAEWNQLSGMMRMQGERQPPRPFSEAIMSIARAMHEAGIDRELPSVEQEIVDRLGGKSAVAVYTGSVTNSAASKDKDAFLAGKKKVIVATMAKGGTGLSLHDKVGNRPTFQVNINLPWVATGVDQVSGRVARYGLQSKARINWLFADNIAFERMLANRVGRRMRDMGALVKGIDMKAARVLTEGFDFSGMADVKQQSGEVKVSEQDIYETAEKLEKNRRQTGDQSGGFFETPFTLAALMADITGSRGKLLEPSAGRGNLVRFAKGKATSITLIEKRADNADYLRGAGYDVQNGDFLETADRLGKFDTIHMNPPFERVAGVGAQDVAHVMKAADLLAPGGRLVAIMGEGAFFRQFKQEQEFRQWLDDRGAIVIKLPEDAFKNSNTKVRTRMVVIDQGAQSGRTDIDLADMDSDSLRSVAEVIPARDGSTLGTPAANDETDSDLLGTPPLTPAEQAIVNEQFVGTLEDKRTLMQKFRDYLTELRDYAASEFRQKVFDSFNSINRLQKRVYGEDADLDASVSPYKAARLTKGLPEMMKILMQESQLMFSGGSILPKAGTKGLFQILKPLEKAGTLKLWENYVAAKRASRLLTEGKEKNFGRFQDPATGAWSWDAALARRQIDDRLALAATHPEFEAIRLEYVEFQKSLLDMAEEAGLISADQRATWEKMDYVPFYRIAEEVDGGTKGPSSRRGVANQRSGIRKLKGGPGSVAIVENMMRNAESLLNASVKNDAMRLITDLADSVKDMLVRIPYKAVPFKTSVAEVIDTLEKAGIDTTNLSLTPDELDEFVKFWRMQAPNGKDVVSVMVNGKPIYYRVKDPTLLRSVLALGPRQHSWWMNALMAPKNFLTGAVTLDPAFMAANTIRDSFSAWVIADSPIRPGYDSAIGFVKSLRNDPVKVAMMAAGGGSGHYNAMREMPEVRKYLRRLSQAENKAFRDSIIDSSAKAWELWQELGRASENANRIPVFESAVKRGASPAEAAFQARDLMDFSLRGDSALLGFFLDTVPFLNARIQGLYKLGRASGIGHGDGITKYLPHGKHATYGAIIGGATLALLYSNWDDDRYWELPEWERDIYWHFWIGKQHVRIPKPFEVGQLFGTVPERMFEYLGKTGDGKLIGKRLLTMIADTFAMNPIPQALKPLAERAMNLNTFTGSRIISRGDEFRSPEQQAGIYTSETMQELAKAMPDFAPSWMRSPKTLEHFVRGYFGSLGMYALNAADALTRSAADYPEQPAMKMGDMMVAKRFLPSSDVRETKFVAQFYDLYTETTGLARQVKELQAAGDVEGARSLTTENIDLLRYAGTTQATYSALQSLRKQEERVQESDVSPEQKREELAAITDRKNDLARRVMENSPRKASPVYNPFARR